MKAPTKILLTITAAAVLSFAHPAKANLITNGGFEDGNFTGWTASGEGGVFGTSGGIAPHSGNFQAVFTGGVSALTQSVATTPGASYTIDFFLASGVALPNSFLVSWGGSTIFSLQDQSGPMGYTEYTFTETASTASTLLHFGFVEAEGGWFLDDVSVNPAGVGVPDAGSTLPLLGFASLGLVALRRKLGLLRVRGISLVAMNGIIAASDSFSLGDISRSVEFEPFKILDGLINSWFERRALRPLRYLLGAYPES
jgi:VPDSG-CTERM motif